MKKIFFLGPAGSYSYSITRQFFNASDVTFVACRNFGNIKKNILTIEQSIGVLPIENSITSDIHENIDYLFTHNVQILSEAFLQINLHLMGLPTARNEDIQEVYSFERALAQCSKFIAEHNLAIHNCDSTALGKDIILQKRDMANGVIGSKALAEDGKLSLLKENIGNDKYNMTRFVFISKENLVLSQEKKNKASVIFKVPHTPGSLAKLLDEIAIAKLNLTKIESRPIPGTNWEYQFWIDIENPAKALDIAELDNLLQEETSFYKILGVYPSGKVYES